MNLTTVVQDVRYALRMLRQSPVFTAVAVGSLALGIGANTAIFTLTDAILLRWLPVQSPQELVLVARNPPQPDTFFNYPDYRYIRDQNRSYAGLIAFSGGVRPVGFSIPGQSGTSQLASMTLVSGNYFDVLGVRPAIGRLFNPADNEKEGAHSYAVLSYTFWKRAFGEDSGVIGRDVLFNGVRFQIIGVSRDGFTGASVGIAPDVFIPIIMYRTYQPSASRWNTRNMTWLTVMGRLKPGITRAAAGAEMNVLWQQILQNDPNRQPVAAWNKDYKIRNTATVLPGSQGYSYLRTQTSKPLNVLMITVGVVLLIACANVANLLLARAVARRKEIAVRLAVGAARARLVSQMLTESITLSVLGGVAGLAVAWIGVKILVGFLPRRIFDVALDLSPDARLLGFAFGLSVLTGLLFGLAPALRASRPELVPALKSAQGSAQGHSTRWDLRRTLVCFQVALSLLLLAGAGLFVRTLANLRGLDPGMNRENLLFVDTNVGQLGYQPQRERIFLDRLRGDVQRLPGVRAAALAAITPLAGSRWNSNVQIDGYQWKPDEPPHVDMNAASPRYFEAAGIPIVLGRDFRQSDTLAVLQNRPDPPLPPKTEPPDVPGPPRVAVVNEAFVRKFFGAQPALSRRFSIGDKWNPAKVYEIVGVVRDARYFELRKAVEPMIYLPAHREPYGGSAAGTLCVRTTADPGGSVEMIRRLAREIEGAVSITDTRTMEDNLNRILAQERFVAMLGGFFGLVALLLAAIGLYGVMSQAVAMRTREIGIRMALGAQARKVLWSVLHDAMVMVTIGAVAGTIAALALTHYAESLLFGIKPQDPATLVLTGLLLTGVTAIASFIPARRATRVDPMRALRHE